MRFFPAGVLCMCLSFFVQAQEVITLPTRDGVTQSYLLLQPASGAPQAVAVLFPGGGGNIRLRLEGGQIKFGPNNFLVRSRNEFVQRGIAAALMDAPSDQQSGMNDDFRSGAQHRSDIQAVVADLNQRFPAIPIFFVGTSRGTVSAGYLGRSITGIAGVVLTSSVFLAAGRRAGAAGLSGFDFSSIKSPVLLVHHRLDGCNVTPYRAAQQLADRFPLVSVSGGKPAESTPCEALSEHGFLGKEAETVEAIVQWMLKQPYGREID
jgi:alpha-beta hydrolase superfamily lysophospholipase